MASIEEVKAALAQAAEQGNSTQQQIRAAIEATEQTLSRLPCGGGWHRASDNR